ncbi:MAG TPA: hypothetical protein PK402_11190 [Tepidisphaeraceae bacterium]|nr:hypothetical protein [Tepidisphaeraceae bacterium]
MASSFQESFLLSIGDESGKIAAYKPAREPGQGDDGNASDHDGDVGRPECCGVHWLVGERGNAGVVLGFGQRDATPLLMWTWSWA